MIRLIARLLGRSNGLETLSDADNLESRTIYKLEEAWDNLAGAHCYRLYEGIQFTDSSTGEKFMKTMSMTYPGYLDEEGWHFVASGDRGWADRTANHYGIDIKDGDVED